MSRTTRKRKGFTLIEAFTATFIALYIFLGAWAVYMMVISWWAEIAPRVEAERIARMAISYIADGAIDSTAGTYQVGGTSFARRCGLAWATMIDDIAWGTQVTTVNYGLTNDASKARSFYLGDDAGGQKAVFYKDNAGTVHEFNPTIGITNLTFEKYLIGVTDLIKVTATVTRTITSTRSGAYTFTVTYSDVLFLRNA